MIKKRTSGAKALIGTALYGTAEAVPFVERRFSIWPSRPGAVEIVLERQTE
jgi:hypothetical protein